MSDHVQIYNPVNGRAYATAPTPKNSDGSINKTDSSDKIATTEWVNSKKFVQKINTREPDNNGNVNIPLRGVGDEWFSYTGKIPAGGVPYCGQTVTREDYSDLWNYVQAQGLVKTETEWQELNTSQKGNVPFYSYGDGSTTFRMPKVVGYIKGVASIDDSGSYTAEGLPNIEGKFEPNAIVGFLNEESSPDAERTGPFGIGDENLGHYIGGSPTYGGYALTFDASKANDIYGNSYHVTPETATVLFGVYAFGELTVTGSTTTDALATGLATLESNIESHIRVVSTWKDPTGYGWYRRWSDGWIEQGGLTPDIPAVGSITINLPHPLTSNLYTVIGGTTDYTVSDVKGFAALNRTKTSFSADWYNPDSTDRCFWYACGY